jgi:hypothetical protein
MPDSGPTVNAHVLIRCIGVSENAHAQDAQITAGTACAAAKERVQMRNGMLTKQYRQRTRPSSNEL